ncbi:MAG: cysteine--tRNA ligase [Pseudomonadota bacterium]
MNIELHDSRTGAKRAFVPQDPARVTMYVCGPTVYSYVHIGNGRPAVVFDTLYRLLRLRYPQVLYARNVTDIDDKINAAALANGEPIKALADRYTAHYNNDIASLNVLDATVVPRATEHIPEIIAMIEQLIAGDYAYAADGHVLFHVPADPAYGQLSRRSLEDMLAGARVDVAPYKRDPKDFVLWKPSTDELPGWDSPWGRGRPGWHIECSAMIEKHLGDRIDIHGGGSDLIFPHHENEAAQSRCALGQEQTVGWWLHNGMLTLGDEKMSKSLGNVLTIAGLREQHSGDVLRYALLSAHYRSSLAWSDALLTQARKGLDTFYSALRTVPALRERYSGGWADAGGDAFPDAVLAALADDLNTPAAIRELHALASEIHKATDEATRTQLGEALLAGGWLLGLLTQSAEAYFTAAAELAPERIEALIDERRQAKADRDFARADAIRESLQDAGIELEDSRDGTTRWRAVER